MAGAFVQNKENKIYNSIYVSYPHDKYLFAQKNEKTIKNKADHIYCVDNKNI